MKRLWLLIPVLILLAACNNRENLLLPPDLSAADYLTGNTINAYSDYLIKSGNDSSYLYLPKESIADNLVNYGDQIVFRRVDSFGTRDSLAFQEGTEFHSDTYEFSIVRNGISIAFAPGVEMARIYTDLQSSYSDYQLISYDYYLQASPITPSFYGSSRAWFPVSATGEFALGSFSENAEPSLSHEGNTALHTLLVKSNGAQVGVNLSAAYCQAAGQIQLSLPEQLVQTEQSALQRFFPSAALATSIIRLSTTGAPGNNLAYLRYRSVQKAYFGTQWTRLTASTAYTWPETDNDSATSNWWQDDTGLYSFLSSSGSYFLLEPLSSQNEVSIPLDGSYTQVFLQNIWFDTSSLNLPNSTLKVSLQPDLSPYRQSYFSGSPYALAANAEGFELQFYTGSTPLSSLPDGAWLEFGFHSGLSATANDRLFHVYRDATQDFITYKTSATAYDATHYIRSGNYVYTGISTSGAYLYGACTESSSFSVPYLKSVLYLQSSQGIFSWDNRGKDSFSSVSFDLAPSLPVHPWLSGEPFTLGGAKAVAKVSSYLDSEPQSTLPGSLLLALPLSSAPSGILLFSDQDYPRLKHYTKSNAFTGSTFTYSEGTLKVYPEYPGTLISAFIPPVSALDIRLYPTMTFSLDEILLYTYGHADAGQSSLLHLKKNSALADPHGILSNQYNLSQTSAAYTLTTANQSDYSTFEPMLFFKRSNRGQELLIYESTTPWYRLYPYRQSTEFDPWAFMIDNGYNGIAVAYNGSYASFTDHNPHVSVSVRTATPPDDTVLSLYQAQMHIPAFFSGNALPVGSSTMLSRQSSVPGVSNLLAAYTLTFQTASGSGFLPNFYNVVGATQEPYIYLPVDDPDAVADARLFFINHLGQTTELNRVNSFSDAYATEYTVFGNSLICTVPNPGVFYITGVGKKIRS